MSETERLALTHPQKQIWVGQRLHPESPLYNMAFSFLIEEDLDPDLFLEAWRRVADGSDALRSRILVSDDGVALGELAAEAPATEVLDFSERVGPERAFRDWCLERASRPLALDGDLVESALVRLGSGRTGWYLNQHHLITDAWSTQLLFRQVGAEYAALVRGGDAGERKALAPYYASFDGLPRRDADRDGALDHWSKRLSGPGRLVSLYGRDTEPVGTSSTRLSFELDEERSRALDSLSRQDGFRSLSEDLSRFSLMAALSLAWLHRIGGSRELGFDTPVAGRTSSDAKRALGLFIEMFPFELRVGENETFRTLGEKCLNEATQLLRHSLPGISAPSGSTAAKVVLNFFPSAFGPFAGNRAEVEWVHPGHGDSVHALRIQVHDFGGTGRYRFHFDFNDGALEDRLRRRSLQHFRKLLDAALADPDRSIGEIDLLTDEERRAFASLNATGSHPTPDETVVAKFRSRVMLEPESTALRQGNETLTFRELWNQSEALASTLVRAGVAPGERVAIFCERSIHAVIAILGTLRAGAAYVPIDASTPPPRIRTVLDDSGARVVLLGETEPFSSKDASSPEQFVQLPIAEAIAGGLGLPLDRAEPNLDEVAYLIYTSGSTGRPKGVTIEHGGLADYLDWASRQYVRGDKLGFPLFTSLGFDLTVTSLFLPLITGGTLFIYSESAATLDTALMDVIDANEVDFIKLTPSHLSLLARRGLDGSRLSRMVIGGENLTTHLAAAIQAQFPHTIEMVNEYGPTEAVVGCMIHRYDPSADTGVKVPIGVPADHVELEILNETMTPVPEGVPGELVVSRYGLARGYHGLEELTRERFGPHANDTGKRRYRTGDLVRMVDSSKLEYLGRIDRQLKVSGFRVEPAEIESALGSFPGIDRCVVLAATGSSFPTESRVSADELLHCHRCGLPSNYPQASFDAEGVCQICRAYESVKEHAQHYFKTMDELEALFDLSRKNGPSKYDCMMLYSGGKDSTYALCRLVEMGLSVYAFTLDNGYLSEEAKENIGRVSSELGVPMEFASTPAMPAIFRDSLQRFSNVCNGCFKTIYTLAMTRASELSIPIVVTGLSRGQMFETRLNEEMFRDGRRSAEEIDAAVLAARKVYHRLSDEVTRSLDTSLFDDDRIFENVRFVDFYRFCDVGLDEVYAYLARSVPWVRPRDTGRSTNCLINDLGIYVHKKQRGFHNYALPYSWDVRMGHKRREAALAELDDAIDEPRVEAIMREIGYEEPAVPLALDGTTLEAFYRCSEAASPPTDDSLRNHLSERLPPPLVPSRFHRVTTFPLTSSGKVDEAALKRGIHGSRSVTRFRAPEGPVEEYLAGVWQEELGLERVGADDSFFELGGTSLSTMQVMLRLCREYDIDLPLDTIFAHPRLSELARLAEDKILADVSEVPDDGLESGSQARR